MRDSINFRILTRVECENLIVRLSSFRGDAKEEHKSKYANACWTCTLDAGWSPESQRGELGRLDGRTRASVLRYTRTRSPAAGLAARKRLRPPLSRETVPAANALWLSRVYGVVITLARSIASSQLSLFALG